MYIQIVNTEKENEMSKQIILDYDFPYDNGYLGCCIDTIGNCLGYYAIWWHAPTIETDDMNEAGFHIFLDSEEINIVLEKIKSKEVEWLCNNGIEESFKDEFIEQLELMSSSPDSNNK